MAQPGQSRGGIDLHMKRVAARSEAFVWWRNYRYGGCRFANRKLCGWRVGRP